MEVIVRNNNVEKALRVLKKKIKNSGLMTELRDRQHYIKPSEKRRLAKKRGIKRVAKEQAKRDAMT
jgi:small subunit ribosomal protein S21